MKIINCDKTSMTESVPQGRVRNDTEILHTHNREAIHSKAQTAHAASSNETSKSFAAWIFGIRKIFL